MRALLSVSLLACCAFSTAAPPSAELPKVLHLAANFWEPYTAPDLPGRGIATDIVTTALARAGYSTKVSFMPWSRALTSVYRGHIDGLVGVWPTRQRDARLAYSDSYLSNDVFLFYLRPEFCDIDKPSLQASLRLGVGRDYEYSDAFLSRYGSMQKPVDRGPQNLLKLQAGRIDLMLEDKRALEYMARHYGPQISKAQPRPCTHEPLLRLPLHLGLSRSLPQADRILAAFNTQLRAMKSDGTLDTLLRRQ